MKNKIISLAIMTASLFTMTGCLDMEPVSSITDKNMWESEGQFTSFVHGVHSRLRELFQYVCFRRIAFRYL